MEKKLFEVKMRLGDNTAFMDINYKDEWFYLQFEEEDEWAVIHLKDGTMCDVHLLKEEKYEVSIYHVTVTQEIDTGTGIVKEYLDTDTSEEGQQIVELEETIGTEPNI